MKAALKTALAGVLVSTALVSLGGCGKSSGTVGDHLQGQGAPAAGKVAPAGAETTTEEGPAGKEEALAGGAVGVATGNTTRVGGPDAVADAAAVAQAVYPGQTTTGRPEAVVIVDVRQWPAALASSVLAAAPLKAPILYSEGANLPEASSAALSAMDPTGAPALGGAQVIAVGDAPEPAGYSAVSVRAGNPYSLAAKIARMSIRVGGGSGHAGAALVAGIDGPRALSMPAAGLAAQSGTPILLVTAGGVPAATRSEIDRLGVRRLYVIGPAAAVTRETMGELEELGQAVRVGGSSEAGQAAQSAVSCAIAVATFDEGDFGWGVIEPGHGLVFARASRPLDAPAAAPLSSSAEYGPLLLLDDAKGIPAALREYLEDIQPGYGSSPESRPVRGVYNRGWLIGDEKAISLRSQAQLDGLLKSIPAAEAQSPSPRLKE